MWTSGDLDGASGVFSGEVSEVVIELCGVVDDKHGNNH